MGEQPDAREAAEEIHARRHESPTVLIRAATAEIARRRFSEGIAGRCRSRRRATPFRRSTTRESGSLFAECRVRAREKAEVPARARG